MKTIDNDIKTGQFKQIYLLYGEEQYLIRQYRDKLKHALAADDDTMNFSAFSGSDINQKEIIDLAETLPFFADRRLILIEDSGLFKKSAEELADYMSFIPETTYFVFAEKEIDKKTKMYKQVKKNGSIVEFPRQNETTLSRWIEGRIRRNGKNITRDAYALFIRKTGDDMENIDKELEKDMDEVLEIVVMGRAARNTANIKNRQPIGTMYVKSEFQLSEFYKEIIEDELNVKEVVFKDDIADFISYSFKPQMRTVGPKYGKLLNKIKTVLSELDGNKAMAELKSTGELKLDIDGQEIVLLEEDLLIDMAQMEGYVSESDHTITVVLDTNLTPELIEEGFVRELVSKIQTMRKEAGFEVMDKIRVYAKDNDKIVDIMKNHGDEIKSEVLAEDIVTGETKGYEKEWNINSEKVTMAVERI